MRLAATVLAAFLAAAPVAAADENVVAPAPLTAIPDVATVAVGTPFMLRSKQTLIEYRIVPPSQVHLTGPRRFDVSGLAVELDTADDLTLSQTDYRMAGQMLATDRPFCSARRKNIAARIAGFLSRFGQDTRVCLLDRDGDGRFDAMFLAGAKKVEDRGVRSIEPAAFEPFPTTSGAEPRLILRFWGYAPLGGEPMFEFKLIKDGKDADILSYHIRTPLGYVSYSPSSPMKPVKYATEYPLAIGTLDMTVLERGRPAGTITLRFNTVPGPEEIFAADRQARWVPASIPWWQLEKMRR